MLLNRIVSLKILQREFNPKGYEDIEDYSLFGVYTIENNDAWENIKMAIGVESH